MFAGVLKRDQWQELGYDLKTNFSKIQQLKVLDMSKHEKVFTIFKGKGFYSHLNLFNTFVPNAPYLYPLKSSESLTVFRCF